MAEQELSDAEVMQPGEMSAADVSAPRKGRQGGLLQAPGELLSTIPQFGTALANPEQRAKIPSAMYQTAIQPIIDAFTPHPEGQTPEQETEQAFNLGAILTLGRANPFLKGKGVPGAKPEERMAPAGNAPQQVADEFHEGVIVPAAQRIENFARTGDPNGVRLEPPEPATKPSQIMPIEGSPFGNIPRSVAAK